NANLWIYVVGGTTGGSSGRILPGHGGHARCEEGCLPKLSARRRIGVKGIDAVVFRGKKYDVARRRSNGQVGHIQGLSIDIAVHWAGIETSELRLAHCRG